jgi:endonuclease G
LLICFYLPVFAQPVKLSDWSQPYIDKSINNITYTSVLNCNKKTPYYVFYDLYPNDFSDNTAKRKNIWPSRVPNNIKLVCGDYAITKDYAKSGYDRGHLAPVSDFDSSQDKENSTFSFANAAPQNKTLNRGEWEQLERYERDLAIRHNGITVITGIIQSQNKYIGDHVGVPDYFYKMFLWKENGKVQTQTFIAPNTKSKPQQIDITTLERQAGLSFKPNVQNF